MRPRQTGLHFEEVVLLFDQQVEELEERRCREADDVLVVPVHLAYEHAAETLTRTRPALATRLTRIRRATHLHGEPARAVEPLAAVNVRLEQLLRVVREMHQRALVYRPGNAGRRAGAAAFSARRAMIARREVRT